jgi:hypothetical protein
VTAIIYKSVKYAAVLSFGTDYTSPPAFNPLLFRVSLKIIIINQRLSANRRVRIKISVCNFYVL